MNRVVSTASFSGGLWLEYGPGDKLPKELSDLHPG